MWWLIRRYWLYITRKQRTNPEKTTKHALRPSRMSTFQISRVKININRAVFSVKIYDCWKTRVGSSLSQHKNNRQNRIFFFF